MPMSLKWFRRFHYITLTSKVILNLSDKMVAIRDSCFEKSNESVPEYFAGKNVFITGGTGFLGKVIIEKILYSCPRVQNIFMLVREKKNVAPKDRMKSLLDCPVFKRLKEVRSEDLQKIVPIVGDITAPNLGIKPEDEKLLIEKVSVVIHAAATVKFNEPLKVALSINVEGTRKVVELCHRIKSLQVFVHVSTAYCNTTVKVVEEKLYPPPMDLDKAHEMAKDSVVVSMQSLGGRPNTYTFTKALAENLVSDLHGDIPTVIVRPSIVTPSKSEPMEGWVENWAGPTALLISSGRGICRVFIGHKDNIMDIIPVDYVCNAILVAAAKCKWSADVKVFQSCSSSVNPTSIGEIADFIAKHCVKRRLNDVPYPQLFGVTYVWVSWLIALFLEVIPVYFADIWRYVQRKPARYVKIQAKVAAARSILRYFTSHSWVMQTGNMSALAAELSPEDARLFPCIPSDICWKDYSATYVNGVQRYLIDKARK